MISVKVVVMMTGSETEIAGDAVAGAAAAESSERELKP
jgi:hypothetical protein